MEIKVVGATLNGTNKMNLYKTNLNLKVDTEILVQSEDGLAIAKIVKTNHKIEISEDNIIVHTIIDGRRNFEDIIISKLSRYYGNKV